MPAGIGSMTSPAKTRTTRGMSTAASASRLGLPLQAEGGPTTAVQGRDEADGVSGDEADPTEIEDHEGEDAPAAPSDGVVADLGARAREGARGDLQAGIEPGGDAEGASSGTGVSTSAWSTVVRKGRAQANAPAGAPATDRPNPSGDALQLEEAVDNSIGQSAAGQDGLGTPAGRAMARHAASREAAAAKRTSEEAIKAKRKAERAEAAEALVGIASAEVGDADADADANADTGGGDGGGGGNVSNLARRIEEAAFARLAAEAERLGDLLAKHSLSQLAGAMASAGFESIDDLQILQPSEVMPIIQEAFGAPLGPLRTAKLERMLKDVATAHVQVDPPLSEPQVAATPADAVLASSPLKGKKPGAFAPKQAKKKSKASSAAAAASASKAPQPSAPRAASTSVQRALAGIDAGGDSEDGAGSEEEVEPPAPPVFAPHPDDDDDELVSIVSDLPHLAAVCDRFTGAERSAEATSEFVCEALRMLGKDSHACVDVQAVELEMRVAYLVENGFVTEMESATSMKVAWLKLLKADARAMASAERKAANEADNSRPPKDDGQHVSLRSVAQVSAAAAANAAASAVNKPSDNDESADERKLRASEAEDRLWTVAQDPILIEELESMARDGRAARSENQHRQLLKDQKNAQKESLAIAELLHTKDLPATSGACLDSLACLPDREREERESAVKRVLKATSQLVGYIHVALVAIETSKTMGKKGGLRLVRSLWYGNFGAAANPTGSYKITEVKSESNMSALAKESEASARSIMQSCSTAVKACLEWGHPRDETARGTIDFILAKCAGESGNEMYHGVVCDCFFSELADMWSSFQSGSYDMPSCEGAWDVVKETTAVKEVLNGNVSLRRQMEEQQREIQALKNRPAHGGGKEIKGKPPGKPPGKPADAPTPDGQTKSDNRVQGTARKALGLKRYNAKKAVMAASSALAVAKQAGDAGEVAKCEATLKTAKEQQANCDAEWEAKL